MIMTTKEALEIIAKNDCAEEGSLMFTLHEKSSFSVELFRILCNSIATVVHSSIYTDQLTEQISNCYQKFLKMIIWHFDPHDLYSINGFPDNYQEYIDYLDIVILAYYRKNPTILNTQEFFF